MFNDIIFVNLLGNNVASRSRGNQILTGRLYKILNFPVVDEKNVT